GIDWWLELDSEMLVCGEGAIAGISENYNPLKFYPQLDAGGLYVTRGLRLAQLEELGVELVAKGGRSALVLVGRSQVEGWQQTVMARDWGNPLLQLKPVVPDLVNHAVVREFANQTQRRWQAPPQAAIAELVDEIDGNRWFSDLSTLTTYNRWTLSPDILNARDWLVQEFEALPGLDVTTPSFSVSSQTAYNVIATLPGKARPNDWYIVGGHYDATSENPSVAAPGAEDNASGCAGVLELARILTDNPTEATLLFICYSGEEQGLYGSLDHVSQLLASGDDSKLRGAVIMDMIGFTADSELDCLLETESPGASLMNALSAAAAQYTTLTISTSMSAWGSDHVPYLDEGLAAVLAIENDWFQYPHYHRTTDTPDKITIDMGRQILRMNLAAIAELAGSAGDLIFADGFESGNVSAWGS
ncbi:MAG: M28 family peptidase, partial [bacterium]|nr:M28 family peptidase [bacterium]